MDIEKLIERLEAWNEQHLSVVCGSGHFACDYLCESEDCIVVQAATALSTLQAENEKLRAELERVKRERDAAVASWCGFCAKCAWNGKQYLADGKMDDRCKTCRENGKCNWQWRGQKEDGNG